MSPAQRAQRLIHLYHLQSAVTAEIADLERAARREAEAVRRARESALAAGVKLGRNDAKCGTDSGYYRHRRKFNEAACEPCKLAHRVAERARHSARMEKANEEAENAA